MPSILLINGFRFFFFFCGGYRTDSHTCKKKGDGEEKVWLLPEIKIAYLIDFTAREEKQIMDIVQETGKR